MVIKVKISGRDAEALIDSGATKSLIKRGLANNCQEVSDDHPSCVIGLGGNKVKILGKSNENISLVNLDFNLNCLLVAEAEIEYDLILGIDFLHQHKFKVDVSKRCFSVRGKDNSLVRIYLNDNNEVLKVMMEEVPVYCNDDFKIKPGEYNKVPVNFKTLLVDDDKLFYYEGDKVNMGSLDGIMSGEGDRYVLIDKAVKHKNIKKGEILGHVYSLMTVEEDQENDTEYEDWDEGKIASQIVLYDNLNDAEKDEVRKMLFEMKLVLSKGDNDIGEATVEPHHIEVTQKTPIWQKKRYFSQPVNDEIEQQCSELLAHDILEYSNSDWSSAVVPVRKTDGKLRICVDYRQVNQVTKKENYPMPNLMNCIYRPNKVKFFTKIDLVRGYYQVPIEEESRQYTAFSTPQHHYQFKRLSFGLKNSGMAFQKVMQQILAPLLSHNIIIYIDDILIMSRSFKEHVNIVSKVLRLLNDYKIKIKVSKCEMFREEVSFLGHLINSEGIRKSPEFVEKVRNVKRPQNVREMRKFLGLVNFQRKFVKNCSLLTAPLTQWTVGDKGRKIVWNEEMEQAFHSLKEEVMKDVLLSYPDYSKEANKMELYVDASSTGCGAYLMQRQQEYKVIAYNSMTFSDTQRRYSPTDRELAALRWGISNFRCFLAGVSFILITDCKPLIFLNNMAPSNSRLMRTLEEMAEFDFELKYRPGVSNEAADFLSRMDDTTKERPDEDIFDHKYLPKEVKKICEVPGGGDSMFESLCITMKDAKENGDFKGHIPTEHKELRAILVDELLKNTVEYGLGKGKQIRQRLKMMRNIGQQPIAEVLLAASKVYEVKILVYHGMTSPMSFACTDSPSNCILRLQCVSLIHYDPLYERKKIENEEIKVKYMNTISPQVKLQNKAECEVHMNGEEEYGLEDVLVGDPVCGHSVFHTVSKVCGD